MRMRFLLSHGFSTIELLVAFSIAVIFLSGVILLTLPSQTTELDASIHIDAIFSLESYHAKITKFLFSSWNGNATATIEYPYRFTTEAQPISLCSENIMTTSTWESGKSRSLSSSFFTTKSNLSSAKKLETEMCDPTPPTAWTALTKSDEVISLDIMGTGTDMSLFVHEGTEYLLITTEPVSSSTSDVWIVDITQKPPALVSELNIGAGAKNVSIKMPYAYVLNASNTEQVKVVDLSQTPNLNENSIVANITLPYMTSSCSTCLIPKSITYFDGYLYIGTPYIANLGSIPITRNNELHIFCVSNPSIQNCSPETPQWLGSFNVNHNVEDVIVGEFLKDGTTTRIAYLATSASAAEYPELTIFDVTNPESISHISSVYPSGNSYGTALSMIKNTLYLGRERTTGTNADFLSLDVSDPWNPTITASQKLGLRANTQVSSIASARTLAYLTTTDSQRPFLLFEKTEFGLTQKEICTKAPDITGLAHALYHHNTLYVLTRDPARLLLFYDKNSCT